VTDYERGAEILGAIDDALDATRQLEKARAYPSMWDAVRAEEAHREALEALGRLFGRGPTYCRCGEELSGKPDKCGQVWCPICGMLSTPRDHRGNPL